MDYQDTYIYPAVFHLAADQIQIHFPDLADCQGLARTEEEAFFTAKALLRDWLLLRERKHAPVPAPSSLSDLADLSELVAAGAHICMIQVCLAPYREAFNNRAIKKTLTIPAWLNELAEKEKVNFSFVLQQALKEQLGLN